MHQLQTANIRSFRALGNSNPEITVTVVNELTTEEKNQLIADLLALEDASFVSSYEQDKIGFKSSHPFFDLSPAQAETWIDANVSGADASIVSALKEMAKAIVLLIRRTDLNK